MSFYLEEECPVTFDFDYASWQRMSFLSVLSMKAFRMRQK